MNPFRYRGYYWDSAIGLYYLNARYYDPETGRFISRDDISYIDPKTLNGLNLFAYCYNNPVMNVDPEGTFVSTIMGAFFGALWGGISAALQGKDFWAGAAHGAVIGALAGLAVDVGVVTGGVGGLVIAAVGGAIAGYVGDVAGQMILDGKSWNEVDHVQAIWTGVITGLTNAASFGIARSIIKADKVAMTTGSIFKKLVGLMKPALDWSVSAIFGSVYGLFGVLPSLATYSRDRI